MKVTALLPVLNEEPYISKCLDSLLINSTGKISVVVSDNCSTDQSVHIISKYRNKSLKLITTTVQVPAVNNWRACFEEANTDFVFTIGGDDLLATNLIDKFTESLEEYSNLGIFYFYFSNFDDHTLEEISTSPNQVLFEKIATCFYCGLKILLFNPSLDEFGLSLHQKANLQEQALLSSDTTQSFFYWLGLLGYIKTCLRNRKVMYHREVSVFKRQRTSYEGKGNFRISKTSQKSLRMHNDIKNAWVVASQINGVFKFELFTFIFLNTLSLRQRNIVRIFSSAMLNRWILSMHSRSLNVMNCKK
jgi:glycosyltransferase involved in cell wall biosynthesis